MATDSPEIDRVQGCAHPRETYSLYGHDEAEQQIISSLKSGRLPHAWLISGSPGIGKATLAYRFARYVLEHGSREIRSSLFVAPDERSSRFIESESHPGLLALRRVWEPGKKRFQTVLSVQEVRKLSDFFGLSSTDDGWRVCIIDSADDMNRAACNALLKRLEEPPPRSLLLLVSHRPGSLLATIRSRCRHLPLKSLSQDALAAIIAEAGMDVSASDLETLSQIAGGSAGRVLQLLQNDGIANFGRVLSLFSRAPNIDTSAVTAFAEHVSKTQGEDLFDLTFDFIALILERAASLGAGEAQPLSTDEKAVYSTLDRAYGPQGLSAAWSEAQRLHTACRALNLDQKQTIAEFYRRLGTA